MKGWSKCDEALYTVARVATILNCISTSIIEGDLPKDTTLDEIGSALGLLYKILDEAHNTLYDEAK